MRYPYDRLFPAPVGFLGQSVNGIRHRGYLRPIPYRAISPSSPLEVIAPPRVDGVGNRPPFAEIMALEEGRLARRLLAMIPPWPDGNRGQHRPT